MNQKRNPHLKKSLKETEMNLLQLQKDLALLDLDELHVESLEERLNLSGAGCVIDTNGQPVYKF
ncbi:hypothetical protein [Candidatus Leptofilum sp.]|uniref:hypothetical protein n=1 Tax=Candidatus Leptofilum sp. TaxID=3241576 RepID=UPI003B5BDFD7